MGVIRQKPNRVENELDKGQGVKNLFGILEVIYKVRRYINFVPPYFMTPIRRLAKHGVVWLL